MKQLTTLFALALVLALTACGDVELVPPEQESDTPAHQREIVLNLQNKLVMSTTGTRATEIATTDEKRIDALDVYVFGSPTLNGVYSYQEKFSYRADGSTVPGADILKMTGADGTTATPTMMLKPHKGLFIKLYCVANQPDLGWLDNATDPATPTYKPYTTFTPLTQSRPGDPVNNVVTPGVPLEADFRKLTTRIIDPVNEADSIVPALPMVGVNVATIDLQDLALASRLFISVKLTRAVARFDIVNRADESRFTITSVALGNGRPTTSLFPLEAQRTAAGELITYPWRQLWGPGSNEGVRPSAFYAYASPKADQGFLILKGTYRVNQTAPPEEVTHKIAFDQVKDGTGGYIEITPNHRYTVEITKADKYHVDFTVKIADWEEDEDMGIVIPDNSVGAISAQPEGLYDAKKKTLILSTTAGLNCTLNLSSNAALSVESVTYDKPGFDWIEVGEVVMAPATTRNGLWTQTGTCPIRTRTGVFDEYPNATLTLKNKASGEKMTIKVTPPEVIVVVPEGSGSSYNPATNRLTLYAEPGVRCLGATVKYTGGNVYKPGSNPPGFVDVVESKTDTTVTCMVTIDKYNSPSALSGGYNLRTLYFANAADIYNEKKVDMMLSGGRRMMYALQDNILGVGSDNRNIYIAPNSGESEVTLIMRSDKGVDLAEDVVSSSWFTLEKTKEWTVHSQQDEFLLKLNGTTPSPFSFKLKNRIDLVPDVTITVQQGEVYNGQRVMTFNGYKVVDGTGRGACDINYQFYANATGCPAGWTYPSGTDVRALIGSTGKDVQLTTAQMDILSSVFTLGSYWENSPAYAFILKKKDGIYYSSHESGYSNHPLITLRRRCVKKQ